MLYAQMLTSLKCFAMQILAESMMPCFRGKQIKDPNNVLLYFGEHNVGDGHIEDAQFSLKPLKIFIHPNRNKQSRY